MYGAAHAGNAGFNLASIATSALLPALRTVWDTYTSAGYSASDVTGPLADSIYPGSGDAAKVVTDLAEARIKHGRFRSKDVQRAVKRGTALAKNYFRSTRATGQPSRRYTPMALRRTRYRRRLRRGRYVRRRSYGRRFRRRYPRRYKRTRMGRKRKMVSRLGGKTRVSQRNIRFGRYAGDIQSIYPERMMVRLSNLLTFNSGFNKYNGLTMAGEEFGFAWNTWTGGGTGPDAIDPWVGQTTLGRVYTRYRIINAITRFVWVPQSFSALALSPAANINRYRGHVYFYAVQTTSSVSPVTGLAAAILGTRSFQTPGSPPDLKAIMQIPSIKIKRKRWAETPDICSLTYGQSMPQSTRIGKDPDYANDNGPFSAQISPGPNPVFSPPATQLFMYFGWFVTTQSIGTTGADFPTYKLELKDITLSSFSGVTVDASLI